MCVNEWFGVVVETVFRGADVIGKGFVCRLFIACDGIVDGRRSIDEPGDIFKLVEMEFAEKMGCIREEAVECSQMGEAGNNTGKEQSCTYSVLHRTVGLTHKVPAGSCSSPDAARRGVVGWTVPGYKRNTSMLSGIYHQYVVPAQVPTTYHSVPLPASANCVLRRSSF